MANVTVVDHPLVQHKLSLMRRTETPTGHFRQLLREISVLLCYEVTRDLPTEQRTIETPLKVTQAPFISGKKLVFMGAELADPFEWNHDGELPFYLLEYPAHAGVMQWVSDLNRVYRETPALHVEDHDASGFQWIEADDVSRSTVVFLRSADGHPPVVVVANFTPEVWRDYRLGVPNGGTWRALLCSDAADYGGSGLVPGDLHASDAGMQGMSFSIGFDVPPLSVTFLVPA